MDNVLKFRPKASEPTKVVGELYETEPSDIDEILDMVRGRLKQMVLVAIDEDGEAIVASCPAFLERKEVLELFNIVNELVFDDAQSN
jgi:hypothetical protein